VAVEKEKTGKEKTNGGGLRQTCPIKAKIGAWWRQTRKKREEKGRKLGKKDRTASFHRGVANSHTVKNAHRGSQTKQEKRKRDGGPHKEHAQIVSLSRIETSGDPEKKLMGRRKGSEKGST